MTEEPDFEADLVELLRRVCDNNLLQVLLELKHYFVPMTNHIWSVFLEASRKNQVQVMECIVEHLQSWELQSLYAEALNLPDDQIFDLVTHDPRFNLSTLSLADKAFSTHLSMGIRRIKKLVHYGIDVNHMNTSGESPLRLAARMGNLELCQLLIDLGADVVGSLRMRCMPLHKAARYGHLEVCRLLIAHGAKVNVLNRLRWSPFHSAAASGHLEICKLLVEHGACINTVNLSGARPIDSATQRGHMHVRKYLIKCERGLELAIEALSTE